MAKNDINEISFKEIFNNYSGKTSSTKFVGVTASLVCLFLFIILVIYYFFNPLEAQNVLSLIDKTTTYFTVSSGLMGVKSITSAFGKNVIKINDEEEYNKKKQKQKDSNKDELINEEIEETEQS